MFDFWNEELSDGETEELLDKAVDEIKKRKLEVPAILMFEMHKPLSFLGSQAAMVFSPFMVPFLGYDAVNNYARLFSKKENVEKLLLRLERQSPEAKSLEDK